MSPSDSSSSDKGLMLETPALETHYGGQFTSSTLVTRKNYFGCICSFLLFLCLVMYDNKFKTKENKIWTKDKIEPQYYVHIVCSLLTHLFFN